MYLMQFGKLFLLHLYIQVKVWRSKSNLSLQYVTLHLKDINRRTKLQVSAAHHFALGKVQFGRNGNNRQHGNNSKD